MGGLILGNLTSKHIKANVLTNNCTCACNILSFIPPYVNGNTKMVVFVVKRYAVHEAKKWRYAVREAKIGRYAVCKGGGGVSPSVMQKKWSNVQRKPKKTHIKMAKFLFEHTVSEFVSAVKEINVWKRALFLPTVIKILIKLIIYHCFGHQRPYKRLL